MATSARRPTAQRLEDRAVSRARRWPYRPAVTTSAPSAPASRASVSESRPACAEVMPRETIRRVARAARGGRSRRHRPSTYSAPSFDRPLEHAHPLSLVRAVAAARLLALVEYVTTTGHGTRVERRSRSTSSIKSSRSSALSAIRATRASASSASSVVRAAIGTPTHAFARRGCHTVLVKKEFLCARRVATLACMKGRPVRALPMPGSRNVSGDYVGPEPEAY